MLAVSRRQDAKHVHHPRRSHAYLQGVDTGGKVCFELRGNEVVVTRADSEHEDPAIGAFLGLLEQDIRQGKQLGSLPKNLAKAMLANLGQAADLDAPIDGDVDL